MSLGGEAQSFARLRAVWHGPNGIRIRVYGLKGRCPRPLDDGATFFAARALARLANVWRGNGIASRRLPNVRQVYPFYVLFIPVATVYRRPFRLLGAVWNRHPAFRGGSGKLGRCMIHDISSTDPASEYPANDFRCEQRAQRSTLLRIYSGQAITLSHQEKRYHILSPACGGELERGLFRPAPDCIRHGAPLPYDSTEDRQ